MLKAARNRFGIPAIILLLAAGLIAVNAGEIPKRKSGLWDMKMNSDQGSFAMQQCIDANTDNMMQGNAGPPGQKASGNKEKCTMKNYHRTGNKFVVESVCQLKGGTATTHATGTGAFDTGYRMQSKTTYNPPMHGMREANMTVEAKWLGPCKPGQRPGDVSMKGMPGMPEGMPNINMQDMMKGRMKP